MGTRCCLHFISICHNKSRTIAEFMLLANVGPVKNRDKE